MTKVELLDSFNTSAGLALLIKTGERVKVGDKITDGKNVYQVKSIRLPSRPSEDDRFVVIV
ncbi:MAG: hypothetical protein ACOX7J_06640 [Bacillota bacterium]|jgi:hypothetical protein